MIGITKGWVSTCGSPSSFQQHYGPYYESETASHSAGVKMLGIVERLGADPLKYSTPTLFEGCGYRDLNEQELCCLAENLPTDDADWEEVNSIYSAVQYKLDVED
jgi:hypothetical protein